MDEQLERVKNKITQLKGLDRGYRLFRSHKHMYELNLPIPMEKVC
jgi:hypothetical protein